MKDSYTGSVIWGRGAPSLNRQRGCIWMAGQGRAQACDSLEQVMGKGGLGRTG